jgi:RNA polymerase sigma factor (sigma-70 family)
MAPPPFQRFLDEHREPVLGFLRAMVGPVDADDCFQETFIAAMRAYSRLNGDNPRAWVLTIARRKALDHHRASSRRPQPRDELPEPAHGLPGAAPPGTDSSDPELWRAVAELPPKQRAAVALRYVADLRYRDVARALECSEEAARRSVHEGVKGLRKAVSAGEPRATRMRDDTDSTGDESHG